MLDAVSQAADAQPLTLTAYAKRRGVSTVSVSKAVARGRLVASVGRNDRGQPTIIDPDLADREWAANTRHRIDATASAVDPVTAQSETAAATAPRGYRAVLPDGVQDYNTSRAVHARASARRHEAQADLAEMDLAKRRGQLIEIADARAEVIAKFTLLRTRLLGVPSRVAQHFPHLAAEIVPAIEQVIHEALEELADMDDEVTQ